MRSQLARARENQRNAEANLRNAKRNLWLAGMAMLIALANVLARFC